MDTIWPETSCDDQRNAHFEAGHAVIAWLEGLEVVRASIEREDDATSWIDVSESSVKNSLFRR